MVRGKMVSGKMVPRKNGPQKNRPREKWSPEKWSPKYWCPEKCPSKLVLRQKNARKFKRLFNFHQLIPLHTHKNFWRLRHDPTYVLHIFPGTIFPGDHFCRGIFPGTIFPGFD